MNKEEFLALVKYDEAGLVPVVVQDAHSKKVRMLAYMNQEALEKTLETGMAHFYSRSRKELWLKGETSLHYQYVKGMAIDCDGDTLVLQVEQEGGISCHTGNATCFYREYTDKIGDREAIEKQNIYQIETGDMLTKLAKTIEERKQNPKAGSYTNYLLDKGIGKILKKVGEETTEVVIAAMEHNASTTKRNKEELTSEIADLMYHLSVLMAYEDLTWESVGEELSKRE